MALLYKYPSGDWANYTTREMVYSQHMSKNELVDAYEQLQEQFIRVCKMYEDSNNYAGELQHKIDELNEKNNKLLSKENDKIDELFNNEHFRDRLSKFVANGLDIRQDYDAYTGQSDEMQFSFNGNFIEVKSKTYGI